MTARAPGERERLEALLRFVQRSIQDPAAPAEIAASPRAWLDRAGLSGPDLEAMERLGPKRLLLYRRRVRLGLDDAIRRELPRTAARMGEAFQRWLDRFYDEELPRSHYLIDVAFELVEWAAPRWALDPALPPWIGDLARHELVAFEGAAEPGATPPARPDGGLDLDRPVLIHPAVRLRRHRFAVHRLLEDLDARDVPDERSTSLLAYRDAEQDVRYLELTPMAAAIVERLLAGETLRAAMVAASAALEVPLDTAVLEGSARLLTDLGERGVLLGAAS